MVSKDPFFTSPNNPVQFPFRSNVPHSNLPTGKGYNVYEILEVVSMYPKNSAMRPGCGQSGVGFSVNKEHGLLNGS